MEHKSIYELTPTEFEKYCCDFLKGFAEKEKLQNFKITHDTKIKAPDGKYQIDANQKMPNNEACLRRDTAVGFWINFDFLVYIN